MEQIRCFIAIELPEELKMELSKLQSQLKAASQASVKWVDTRGIHLTLKFLGNVDKNRVPAIVETMAQSRQDIVPFHLEVAGTGVFPGPKQPRVAWVGLRGDVPILLKLQERIESALVPLGFASEARSFTPHITLGRVRPEGQIIEKQKLAQTLISTRFEAITPLDVKAVDLIKSQLTPTGAIYTRLDEVIL
jgi:RNA 2',3'-cyclic 3'-phosphodiesterase